MLAEAEIVRTEAPRASRGDGPDFICIGAQKAGTQWLYDQLAPHPQFWMPPVKELHIFDRARRAYRRAKRLNARVEKDVEAVNARRVEGVGRPFADRDVRFLGNYVDLTRNKALRKNSSARIEAYARLFAEKDHRLTGDVTPGYSKLREDEAARITARFPEARIVFIAREPIERVWSSFCMAARQKRPGAAKTVSPESVIAFARHKPVAARSYPSVIVERWRKHARDGQLAWFFFDELRSDPAQLRARILGFLGADPELKSGDLEPGFNRKSGFAKIVLTDEIRDALVRHFAEELRRSADLLGGAALEWPGRYGL